MITLSELQDVVNRLAAEYDGDILVDISVNTGGGGYRILNISSVEINERQRMRGLEPESVRIYSDVILSDIGAIRTNKGRLPLWEPGL